MSEFTVGNNLPVNNGQSVNFNSQLQTTQELELEIEQLLTQLTQEETPVSGAGGMGGGGLGGTPNTDNLVQMGNSAQQQGAQTAMQNFQSSDPTDFNAFMNALKSGDGNKATHILAGAVRSGKLDQADAAAIGGDLQQTANENGGGKINGMARADLASVLGQDVLAKGETRDQYAMQQEFGMKA
ncbi:MAG: hypothetical protein LBV73_06390 [Paraburkholderia sp.]|jgi:hypothetical protein|nr:hypothetical protein [Paraburkholderia sp.]